MIRDNRPYRILLIEDNPGDRMLVEDFLTEFFVLPDIVHAPDRATAEQILRDERFDTILLDLSLPDGTGEPLIHAIMELGRQTPVIVLTGYVDFEFGVKSLSFGIADYLLKDDLTAMSLYKSIIYAAERRRITLALQQSERNYSDLFQLSPLPIVVFETSTLKLLDVNHTATETYGYQRREAIGMSIADILHLKDPESLQAVLLKFNTETRFNINGIVRTRVKPGEVMHVDVVTNLVNYKGKDARVLIISDVTERLNHIAAIEEQNRNLREIAWMQSHVIRAPLASIMGLVPLIADEPDPAERQELLRYLAISAHELDGVIKRITDLTTRLSPE